MAAVRDRRTLARSLGGGPHPASASRKSGSASVSGIDVSLMEMTGLIRSFANTVRPSDPDTGPEFRFREEDRDRGPDRLSLQIHGKQPSATANAEGP